MSEDSMPIIKLVRAVLQQAETDRASWIKIVPASKATPVYFWIDGRWSHAMTVPNNIRDPMLQRFRNLCDEETPEGRKSFSFQIYDQVRHFTVEEDVGEFGPAMLIERTR